MEDTRMGGDRRGARRVTAGGAVLLTLTLLLHHPVMGLMPMTPMAGLSGHGLAAAASSMTLPMSGMSRAVAMAGTRDTSGCAGCAMTCPLIDGVTPNRSALPSPTSHRAGHTAGAPTAAVRATLPSGNARGDPTTGAAGHIRAQRTRRAILQVYLL